MVHPLENFPWQPTRAELRQFARLLLLGLPSSAVLWLLIVRMIAGDWVWAVPLWILALGVPLALLLWAVPPLGRPFHRVWYLMVRAIDFVVSNTLLTVFYFLVLTPAGCALRVFRKRGFARGPERSAATYWKPAPPPAKAARYFHQS